MSLTPPHLQFIFIGLLWALVLLSALTFAVPRLLGRSAARAGSDAHAAAPPEIPELLLEAPASDGQPARAERVLVSSNRITIGRASDSDLRLEDEFISSHHAILHRNGSHLLIEDMDSTNGTFVNDLPVRGTASLKSGDVVRLGKTTLKIP